MEKSILEFPRQFSYELKIQNKESLKPAESFAICGMGGSAFPAELIETAHPELNISVCRNYNLPTIPKTQKSKYLVICSSYSGNTEEPISAFAEAQKQKLNLAILTVGGKLLALAKKYKVPFIQIPDTKIQPRRATGLMVRGLSELMGLGESKEFSLLTKSLKPQSLLKQGKGLAENLWDQVPIIYASEKNLSLAYNWKIRFNENAKIPAFTNFFPELNHNEMTGYDLKKTTSSLSSNFHFLFLKDSTDHVRNRKRLAVTGKIFKSKGLNVTEINLEGVNVWKKIFNSILLADWTSFYLAEYYGVDPEAIPMVEDFKKQIR